jgi:hypothetical protein
MFLFDVYKTREPPEQSGAEKNPLKDSLFSREYFSTAPSMFHLCCDANQATVAMTRPKHSLTVIGDSETVKR